MKPGDFNYFRGHRVSRFPERYASALGRYRGARSCFELDHNPPPDRRPSPPLGRVSGNRVTAKHAGRIGHRVAIAASPCPREKLSREFFQRPFHLRSDRRACPRFFPSENRNALAIVTGISPDASTDVTALFGTAAPPLGKVSLRAGEQSLREVRRRSASSAPRIQDRRRTLNSIR